MPGTTSWLHHKFWDENCKYILFCCAIIISRKKYRHMGIREQCSLAAQQGKWNQEIKAITQSAEAAESQSYSNCAMKAGQAWVW